MHRSLLATFAILLLTASRSIADDSTIDMTASDETFTFSPAKVITRVGQPVHLRLTSSEGVHGISSSDLGIDTTAIRPNHPVNVTFTPQKAGSYVVHCAFVCGTGHGGMAFAVDVAP